jgi:hypothetical protein
MLLYASPSFIHLKENVDNLNENILQVMQHRDSANYSLASSDSG